ncbi:hypothetical protein ALQ04_02053 [Pseudomonas cichorii]|uniref:Uncharacterized protein n=1 Tax=Pseudomonas cichorii TaxID=36746 RepID=A0A3M4LPQ4_PSECI|nr:hypothetical protein [Pseudomonas cichorii]RMQ43436.1 hypothetical protein ALQ04_02053 [Pseudomonas cichorii]
MSITIKLSPLATPVPGHAFLQVRGWEHDAGNLEFAIQRNQDDHYLQHDRQWGNAPCWFAQHFVEDADGDSISYQVGPEIVDPLLLSSATGMFNFRLRSPDGSAEDENPMRLAAGLNSSLAGSSTGAGAAESTVSLTPPPAAPEPLIEPVEAPPAEPEPQPEPVVEQAPPAQPAAAKSRTGLLLLGIVLLLAIAAGLWFWLKQPKAPEPVAAPVPAAPVAAPAAPVSAAPCSVEALSSETELNFVQGCIKQSPDSAALLKVIELAKANKQCGVAQRLYANRAQAGNVEVAQAYAREYDPKYLQPSACFTTADNATAVYWYETILSYQADNAEAAQRLKELKP